MKVEDAISFWLSETGFRQTQDYLSKQIHGKSKYAQSNHLWDSYNDTYVLDAIETLRSEMEPASRTETYYRGSPSQITDTHRREGFFSVTLDHKKAMAYGKVYKVYVRPEVPRLKIPFEGGEVLLHDGMVYTYYDNTITVTNPERLNAFVPYLGNLYTKRKLRDLLKEEEQTNRILTQCWCFLHVTPNTDLEIYEEDCDPAIEEEFRNYTIPEKMSKIQQRLLTYEFKDILFSELVAMFQEKAVRNLFHSEFRGGERKIRGTRKTKKTRKASKTRKAKKTRRING